MSRTKRKQPTSREAQATRLEREWRKRVEAEQEQAALAEPEPEQAPVIPAQPLPPGVEEIRQEAEALLNAKAARKPVQEYSVQAPYQDMPSTASSLLWWTGGTLDQYIPISEYGTPARQNDLRTFVLLAPMLLNAISILTKKCQSLEWTIEGGRNLARKWQRLINGFGSGRGWDTFVARWVRAYSECDRGGYAELIRAAPKWAIDEYNQLTLRGEAAIKAGKDASWEIVTARVMDPTCCSPARSREFPLEYVNPYTGKRHRLRNYQFMALVDMPTVDDRLPGEGVCACSRAVWAAQEDRTISRYSLEKMSENPGAGIMVANVNQTLLETALKGAKTEREARGVVYYKGVIFLPILDPSGTLSLEYVSFSGVPDNFDRLQVYNIIKEVTATSFGLDVLEFGSIPGQNLGTATQATVAATKARGKGIGAITQGIEREFHFKLLPPSLEFNIKRHDVEEEKERAEIDGKYFEQAARMVQVGAWMPERADQYLLDRGAIPKEFVPIDLTPDEEIEDTEAIEKRYGPIVTIDRKGREVPRPRPFFGKPRVNLPYP